MKTKMFFPLIMAFAQIVPSSSKSQHRQLSVSVPAGEQIQLLQYFIIISILLIWKIIILASIEKCQNGHMEEIAIREKDKIKKS